MCAEVVILGSGHSIFSTLPLSKNCHGCKSKAASFTILPLVTHKYQSHRFIALRSGGEGQASIQNFVEGNSSYSLTRKPRIFRNYDQIDLELRRLLDCEYGNGLSWHRILSDGHGRHLDSCISPTIILFRPYIKLHFPIEI